MATSDQIKTALLTEHFRYTPLTLLDDIINTVNELVFQAVNEVETALLNVPKEQLGFDSDVQAEQPNDENEEDAAETAARTEIEAGIVKLESLLNSSVDKNFDKLEIYTLRNLLTISNAKEDEGLENWIVLDHYKNLQPPSSDVDAPTPESVDALRRRVQETEKLNSVLKTEVAQNNALLAQLRPLLSSSNATHQQMLKSDPEGQQEAGKPSFAFLTNTPSAAALGVGSNSHATSLAQNTSFIQSQLPALKATVASLRSHLATLPNKDMSTTIDSSTETRNAYIESQTRRALGRVGVDASTTPDAEALGRRVGAEETRALEGIVAAMTAQNHASDKMEE